MEETSLNLSHKIIRNVDKDLRQRTFTSSKGYRTPVLLKPEGYYLLITRVRQTRLRMLYIHFTIGILQKLYKEVLLSAF